MQIESHIYGSPVYWDEAAQAWHYMDGVPVPDDPAYYRPCPQCHKLPTPEGHDACLGTIPGVMFACCGHGVEDGYIRWDIPDMDAIEVEAPRWLRWLLRLTRFEVGAELFTVRAYYRHSEEAKRALSR